MKKLLLRGIFVFIAFLALVLIFGPREDVRINRATFDFGDDLDAYLHAQESTVEGLNPEVQKQILWAGATGEKTDLAIVYLHGFSATNYELRPVPEELAQNLGANLFYTRFAGHGADGAALGAATAQDWLADLQEALAIGERLGQKTLVIATSTGGTLAAIAAADNEMQEQMDGVIFISPNFGINNSMAPLLTLGASRYWLPIIAGRERSWEPLNEGQAKYWTTTYPSSAVFPVAALVKAANAPDYGSVKLPALFYYSPDDGVVDAKATDAIAAQWGGAVEIKHPSLSENDDPFAHVIAGDILSPKQNQAALSIMQDWVERNMQ